MPTISQIFAASYAAVQDERKKATNQWEGSAFLQELERQKAIKRIAFGTTIDHTLDYQRNPGADFLAADNTTVSLAKVEVLTAAQFDTDGQLSVPVVWFKADDARNPSENQKIAFVKALHENADASHDDLIEEALFAVSTDGFLGLQTIVPDSGQGTVGGIDAGSDVWWRNYSAAYASAGTDIEAQLTAAFNDVSRGSGGMQPKIIVSDSGAQALYEAGLQTQVRYIDSRDGDVGFKTLAFKTARWVFSQYANSRIYGLHPKTFRVNVSKDAYKLKGDVIEIPNAHGYVCKIYSMLQTTTPEKNRNFVLTEGA